MDLQVYREPSSGLVRARVMGREFPDLLEAVRFIERLAEHARMALVLINSPGKAGTTKFCQVCGCVELALLRTLDQKHCPDCGHVMSWTLEPGQKPIL